MAGATFLYAVRRHSILEFIYINWNPECSKQQQRSADKLYNVHY